MQTMWLSMLWKINKGYILELHREKMQPEGEEHSPVSKAWLWPWLCGGPLHSSGDLSPGHWADTIQTEELQSGVWQFAVPGVSPHGSVPVPCASEPQPSLHHPPHWHQTGAHIPSSIGQRWENWQKKQLCWTKHVELIRSENDLPHLWVFSQEHNLSFLHPFTQQYYDTAGVFLGIEGKSQHLQHTSSHNMGCAHK